jgi:Leucine-rich repeat (LRR) protein
MMIIKLITIFVTILVQVAGGEKCTNIGTTTFIDIYNCNSVSYQKLARDFKLEEITKLDAGSQNNEFPTINQKMLQGMNNLEKIWLEECKIEKIDENAFDNLKYLSGLSLWGNKIKTLHVNMFNNLENLKELYLNKNRWKNFPPNCLRRT